MSLETVKVTTPDYELGLKVVLDQWYEAPSGCSEAVRIRIVNEAGTPTAPGVARTVSLTDRIQTGDTTESSTGNFYTDSTCTTGPVTSVDFAETDSEKIVYYSDSAVETVRIEAKGTELDTGSSLFTSGTAMSFSTGEVHAATSGESLGGGLATGDFNLDGRQDVAVTVRSSYEIVILFGQADGTIGSYGKAGEYTSFAAGFGPLGIEAGYLDGPGDTALDLVVTNDMGDDVSVHRNNGDGTFAPAEILTNASLQRLHLDDLNNDNYPDIVVSHDSPVGGASVYLNDQAGGFTGPTHYAVGTKSSDVYTGDFDGDGFPELVVPCEDTNNIYILENDGTGDFTLPANAVFSGGNPSSLTAHFAPITGLFDGDGLLDLAYVSFAVGDFAVSLGTGSVSVFAAESPAIDVGSSVYRPLAVDMDGDGDLDIATPSNGAHKIYILENDGAGNFTALTTYNNTRNPRTVAAADINGDGEMDLVSSNTGWGSVSVFYGVP